MTDILVAVDLDSQPYQLVDQAVAWSKRMPRPARVHLRTVSELLWGAAQLLDATRYGPLQEELERHHVIERGRLNQVMMQVPEPIRGSAEVSRGLARDVLVEHSQAHDLMVLGTHGRRGIKRMFLGSVAEHLVRFSAGSVLVLRLDGTPLPDDRPLRVVVPVDPREPRAYALEQVGAWLGLGHQIHVIGALRPIFVTIEGVPMTASTHPELDADAGRLHGLVASVDVPVHRLDMRLATSDNAGATLIAYADEIEADIVVMPTHGRTGLDRLLLGSVAERTVRLANCPVLVVRPPQPAQGV